MKNTRWAAIAAVPALLASALFAVPRAQAVPAGHIRPNYQYPPGCVQNVVPLYGGDMWNTTVGIAPQAWLGIANFGANNQNSFAGGPGTAYNRNNDLNVVQAQQEGTPVIGYIATNGGTGATGFTEANIETQMTEWHRWYGVSRFFLAQVPTAIAYQPYYAAVRSWAQANISPGSRLLWLDMGTYPKSSSWMKYASVLMDWENGTVPATPPKWVLSFAASRFAMIVNQVPYTTPAIDAAVAAIKAAHAGHGFVTSDPTYQTLPTWQYWEVFSTAAFNTCYS